MFQRPQHLLTRAARDYEVIFLEEPISATASTPGSTPTRRPRASPSSCRCCRRGCDRMPVIAGAAAAARRPAGPARPGGRWSPGSTRRWRWHSRGHLRARPDRLRLHGRALRLPRRAAAQLVELERELLRARRPGLHRRPQPLRGEAAAGTRNVHPLPLAASTRRISRQARGRQAGARRPGGASRAPASASSAWSTSGWTSTCSARWPRRGRTGPS